MFAVLMMIFIFVSFECPLLGMKRKQEPFTYKVIQLNKRARTNHPFYNFYQEETPIDRKKVLLPMSDKNCANYQAIKNLLHNIELPKSAYRYMALITMCNAYLSDSSRIELLHGLVQLAEKKHAGFVTNQVLSCCKDILCKFPAGYEDGKSVPFQYDLEILLEESKLNKRNKAFSFFEKFILDVKSDEDSLEVPTAELSDSDLQDMLQDCG